MYHINKLLHLIWTILREGEFFSCLLLVEALDVNYYHISQQQNPSRVKVKVERCHWTATAGM